MELDGLQPGSVRDVSPSVGTWLVVQGYAYPEMRRSEEDDYFTKGRREHRFSGRDRRRS